MKVRRRDRALIEPNRLQIHWFNSDPRLTLLAENLAHAAQVRNTTFEGYLDSHGESRNTLRCLALSESGGVYEGDVTGLEDGAVQFDLAGFEGNQAPRRVVRLDFEQEGTLRNRVWSFESAGTTEGTLILDVQHRKIAPEDD